MEFPLTFPNYKIIELIGEGSFGKVYKAENEKKEVVALKILRKKSRSTKELSALKQEANIHQKLRHPNIIQLLKSLENEKELGFVCEYAVSDLHKLLAKHGSIKEKRAQKLSWDIISALHYLHSNRILHRDLKPPNILLDEHDIAKLCDFGLARNMTLRTQVLTSIKGTPLYMAPEVLGNRGYNHEADLWSLGCIIYEMLTGETPFPAKFIVQLMYMVQSSNIKWPTFLTPKCVSFLQGLLINNPQKRMTWDEILEHEFVKGHILTVNVDQMSPFTKPRGVADQQSSEKAIHASSIAMISQMKKNIFIAGDDGNMMSSRDSIKVNMNLQSDMDETDVDEILNLKNDSDDLETSGDGTDQCEFSELMDFVGPAMAPAAQFNDFQQFKLQTPRMHNIGNFQPVAENPNMIMHRFKDNVDPELQNFIMGPATLPPMFPETNPIKNIAQDLEMFSFRAEKSLEVPAGVQNDLNKSVTNEGDGTATDASSVPAETEEWLQFLLKAIQEVLDGDLDIYKQEKMMTMIVGLLRNSKFNSKLIDLIVQIICLPFAIDMPHSILEDINKLYLQMKLVPNLVFASKLLCGKKFNMNPLDTMSIPKVDELIEFNSSELKTLSGIYDLVLYLVYSGETFIHTLCDAISILNVDNLFRSFLACSSNDGHRLTGSIIALICAILQELPENSNLVEKIILHDDVDLCKLMLHVDVKVRLRTCLMLRLLGRFCCLGINSCWSQEASSCLEALAHDLDYEVKSAALSVIEEFKECVRIYN